VTVERFGLIPAADERRGDVRVREAFDPRRVWPPKHSLEAHGPSVLDPHAPMLCSLSVLVKELLERPSRLEALSVAGDAPVKAGAFEVDGRIPRGPGLSNR